MVLVENTAGLIHTFYEIHVNAYNFFSDFQIVKGIGLFDTIETVGKKSRPY